MDVQAHQLICTGCQGNTTATSRMKAKYFNKFKIQPSYFLFLNQASVYLPYISFNTSTVQKIFALFFSLICSYSERMLHVPCIWAKLKNLNKISGLQTFSEIYEYNTVKILKIFSIKHMIINFAFNITNLTSFIMHKSGA